MADQSLIQGAGALARAESAMSLAGISGAAQAGANIGQAAMAIAADLEKKAKEKEAEQKQFDTWTRRAKDAVAVGGKTGIFEGVMTEQAKSTRLEIDNIATDKSLSFNERERLIREKLDTFNVDIGSYATNLQTYNNIITAASEGNISNVTNMEALTPLIKASAEGRVVGKRDGIYIYDNVEKTGTPTIITFDELNSDKYKIIQKDERLIMGFNQLNSTRASKATNEQEFENSVKTTANAYTKEQKEMILKDRTNADISQNIDTDEKLNAVFEDVVREDMRLSYSPPKTKLDMPDENQEIGLDILKSASTFDGLIEVVGQSLKPIDYKVGDNVIAFRSGVDKKGNPIYEDIIPANTAAGRLQIIYKALDNNPFLTLSVKSDIWKVVSSGKIDIADPEKNTDVDMGEFELNIEGTLENIKSKKARDTFNKDQKKKQMIFEAGLPDINLKSNASLPNFEGKILSNIPKLNKN